jgi:hypothetical protein
LPHIGGTLNELRAIPREVGKRKITRQGISNHLIGKK